MKRDWKQWFAKAGIRAVKTFAQTAISLIPAGVFIADVDWLIIVGTAATAAILSLLTSLAGLPELEEE